ncbi:hypothetical protein QNE34_004362 [Vibrio vulnificus]|nr:hypothetical protein [Vibrio vulnificus]
MSDSVIWFCCFTLAAVGFMFGFSLSIGEDLFVTVSHLLSVSANIATILAAFIAILALNSWKKQFEHQTKFNSLRDLEASALSCLRQVEEFNFICANIELEHKLICLPRSNEDTGSSARLSELFEKKILCRSQFDLAVSDYENTLNLALSDLKESDSFPKEFEFEQFFTYLHSLMCEIETHYKTEGFQGASPSYKLKYLITTLPEKKKKVTSELRKLRAK